MSILLSRFIRPNVQLYRIICQETILCTGTVRKRDIRSDFAKQHKLQHPGFFSTSSVIEKSFSEKIKQELSVIKNVDLGQLKHAPLPATLYGFGGIIPFVYPPLCFILGSYSPFLATAQLMYGATILAFIGGVKWGNALAKDNISHEQIGVSTVPSLVAWVSLLFPEPVGLLIVSSGLCGALYIDLVSSKYPPWFCAMRLALTSIATVSLLTTFLFHIFH